MTGANVERVTTARLLCERLTPEHADELRPIMFERSVLDYLAPGETITEEDFQKGLEGADHHWQRHGFGFWLLRDLHTGEPVGRGGVRWTDATGTDEVEATWVIVLTRRGQGLATELAHAEVETAFGPLDLDELIAYTLPHNAASRRVMDKTGFTYDREFLDDSLPHVLYRRHR
jgi:RimJ/RimL family protein N-acetyltransferase